MPNEKKIGNMKSRHDEKLWWKQRIEKNDYTPLTFNNDDKVATKLLENVQEKTHSYHQPSTITNHEKPFSNNYIYKSSNYYHDDSKCYCSLPTNNDRKNINRSWSWEI